jgi:GTPase SAR1 family protein
VLLCGMSGVGKSTLLRNIKLGTVEHACYPVPREWDTCVAVWNFVAPRRRRTVRPAQVRGAIATARTLR